MEFWRTDILASVESYFAVSFTEVQKVPVGVVWIRNFRVWLVGVQIVQMQRLLEIKNLRNLWYVFGFMKIRLTKKCTLKNN